MLCPALVLFHSVMDKSSPVIVDALDLLQVNLYEHIDGAEHLATKTTEWSEEDIAKARQLIPEILDVIRAVVFLHRKATPADTCGVCCTPWPCRSYELLHELLKNPHRSFIELRQQFIDS